MVPDGQFVVGGGVYFGGRIIILPRYEPWGTEEANILPYFHRCRI